MCQTSNDRHDFTFQSDTIKKNMLAIQYQLWIPCYCVCGTVEGVSKLSTPNVMPTLDVSLSWVPIFADDVAVGNAFGNDTPGIDIVVALSVVPAVNEILFPNGIPLMALQKGSSLLVAEVKTAVSRLAAATWLVKTGTADEQDDVDDLLFT